MSSSAFKLTDKGAREWSPDPSRRLPRGERLIYVEGPNEEGGVCATIEVRGAARDAVSRALLAAFGAEEAPRIAGAPFRDDH